MLFNKNQVAEFLACTPSAAQKLMKEWKVPTIYLGPGRGLGYRWKKDDVEAAVNKKEVNVNPNQSRKRRKKSDIRNLSPQEFLTKHKK